MEGQKIKVLIDGRSYRYTIDSEEQEQMMRKAAASVSDKIQRLSREYRNASPIDIVTIVALSESMGRILSETSRSSEEEAYGKLSADLANYVESLK